MIASFLLFAAFQMQSAEAEERYFETKISVDVLDGYQLRVNDLAFDPARFFSDDEFIGDYVLIEYVADYGMPTYAIAIVEGCLEGQSREDKCWANVTSRIVRAPIDWRSSPPRIDGWALTEEVYLTGARTEEEMVAALAQSRIEWLEVDATRCKFFHEEIRQIAAADQGLEVFTREFSDELVFYAHADTVTLTIVTNGTRKKIEGVPLEGGPLDQVDAAVSRLMDREANCLKPSDSTPPWENNPSDWVNSRR